MTRWLTRFCWHVCECDKRNNAIFERVALTGIGGQAPSCLNLILRLDQDFRRGSGHLAKLTARESRVDVFRGLNHAIESAMNTFRRQATAWQDLQGERGTSGEHGQAGKSTPISTKASSLSNELGIGHAPRKTPVSLESSRAQEPQGKCRSGEAVGAVYWPGDVPGETTGVPECLEARPTNGNGHPAAAGDPSPSQGTKWGGRFGD